MKPYYRDEPSSGTYYHLRTLSCPNVTTRGGEIQISAANSIAYGSPQLNTENDNKNWNSGPLIDPYTGKQIQEVTENGETFYAVFYLKKGKIIEFKGSKEELSKLRYLKFSTKQNAEYWLKLGDGN